MSRSLSVGYVGPTPPDTRPRRSAAVQPPHQLLAAVLRRARTRASRRVPDAAPQPRHPFQPWSGASRPQPAHAQLRHPAWPGPSRAPRCAWPGPSRPRRLSSPGPSRPPRPSWLARDRAGPASPALQRRASLLPSAPCRQPSRHARPARVRSSRADAVPSTVRPHRRRPASRPRRRSVVCAAGACTATG